MRDSLFPLCICINKPFQSYVIQLRIPMMGNPRKIPGTGVEIPLTSVQFFYTDAENAHEILRILNTAVP